jgi:hypothetical protein
VGDVLKQGRYEPQRPYNFPAMERRRNAKIDIYRHVGSCVIAVEPEGKSSHEVPVASNDPTVPQMKLKVNIASSGVDATKQKETRTKAVKSQAKDYLMKHQIEEKLSEAVKALLKEQPGDPTEFLVRHLTGGASIPPSPAGGFYQQIPSPVPASSPVKATGQVLPAGKPGPLAMKPFQGYYTAACLPNLPADGYTAIYARFPKAVDRLVPTASSAQPAPDASVFNKMASVGTWLVHRPPAAAKEQEVDITILKGGQQEAESKGATQSNHHLPSVGTWLTKPQGLKKTPTFSKMASVGTWLMPVPPAEEDSTKAIAMPNNLLMGPQFYSLGLPNGVRVF